MLLTPVTLLNNALLPTPVLSVPDVFAVNALNPKAVLLYAVLLNNVLKPNPVFPVDELGGAAVRRWHHRQNGC